MFLVSALSEEIHTPLKINVRVEGKVERGERYASVILKLGKGLEAVDAVSMNAHWGKPRQYILTNSL